MRNQIAKFRKKSLNSKTGLYKNEYRLYQEEMKMLEFF
jgi:hypothetical protein